MLDTIFQLLEELVYIGIFLVIFVCVGYVIIGFYKAYRDNMGLDDFKESKGLAGEKEVEYELSDLSKLRYKVIHDVYIPYNNSNKTAQCDHIIISKFGVFVIETKNYSGKIVGKVKDEKWKQILGKKTYEFYNPIMQNDTHINAVAQYLGIKKSSCISVVNFCSRCDITGVSKSKKVTNTKDLLDLIKSNRTIIFNNKQVNEMFKKLKDTPKNKQIVAKHKKYVKSKAK